MGKLTDIEIRGWIKAGEHFEGRTDGDGLHLRFREGDAGASRHSPAYPSGDRLSMRVLAGVSDFQAQY